MILAKSSCFISAEKVKVKIGKWSAKAKTCCYLN